MRSREMRGVVSRQINLFDFHSNALELGRTDRFIGVLGVTVQSKRSTVTMERSILDRFKHVVAIRSRRTVWMICAMAVIKTHRFVTVGS